MKNYMLIIFLSFWLSCVLKATALFLERGLSNALTVVAWFAIVQSVFVLLVFLIKLSNGKVK